MRRSLLGAAICAAAPGAALAQSMDNMRGMTMPATPASPDHHDMAAISGMAMMGDGVSSPGSGTARLPANDHMTGLHIVVGDWMLMVHGYAWASWTDQGRPRGSREAFVQSMAMVEASRPVADGVDLTLRSMLSADPLMGERGYPNLFASGETAHGLALIDRQHPHDLVMELSGRIDVASGAGSRLILYAALPGEPALGPSAFMHRGSARFDPEAPITHHWFDSTHISWGVVTAGYATRHWQVEASRFKGREPDENRTNIETPRLDSWSVRATWNPTPAWSVEMSYGALHSPEALHPEEDERRLIASVSYSAHGLALIDRQHPHDLLMELSGRIDVTAGTDSRFFVYGGLPGEPALGPSAFMHRGSARFDPEAPITHHWFDSTHISWGVATAGYATRHWQVEASGFKGREPDEDRTNIETPRLDSWSIRATWNPTPAWSAEVSYGVLHSPEALHPEEDERRLIASVSYSAHGLDVTAGYARKAIRPGRVLPAWMLEGTYAITRRHALFGRFENVLNTELFEREEQLGLDPPLAGEPFRVSKFTAGYAYTLPLGKSFAVALGGAASAYAKSDRLDAAYGRHPHSLTLFAKLMLGR